MDTFELNWWYVLLPIVLLYAIGIWLGNKGRIIVYRNYNDIMIVGLLVIIPAAMISLLTFIGNDEAAFESAQGPLIIVTLGLMLITLLLVVIRTFIDNKNPIKAILALYVKIPTAIMFFVHLLTIFTGTKRNQRRNSIFWAIIMLPLLYGLVHDKSKGKLPGHRHIRS